MTRHTRSKDGAADPADKCIYIPGRSVEEMKAELSRERGDHELAPVRLTKAQARDLAERIEDTSIMLGYAETAFGFLARLHQDGSFDGHLGFEAVSALCGRALRGTLDSHADGLEGLVNTLREAGKVEGQR